MSKLIVAACAVAALTGILPAPASAAAPARHGVLTALEPGLDELDWRGPISVDASSAFTSIGVISQGGWARLSSPRDPALRLPRPIVSRVVADAGLMLSSDRVTRRVDVVIAPQERPGGWPLVTFGLVMIAFALGGLLAASRRLARLARPDTPDA
jgi:hypothetical protein